MDRCGAWFVVAVPPCRRVCVQMSTCANAHMSAAPARARIIQEETPPCGRRPSPPPKPSRKALFHTSERGQAQAGPSLRMAMALVSGLLHRRACERDLLG